MILQLMGAIGTCYALLMCGYTCRLQLIKNNQKYVLGECLKELNKTRNQPRHGKNWKKVSVASDHKKIFE